MQFYVCKIYIHVHTHTYDDHTHILCAAFTLLCTTAAKTQLLWFVKLLFSVLFHILRL